MASSSDGLPTDNVRNERYGRTSRILPGRKFGSEPFTDGGRSLGATLSDFWAWSVSDLIDNITRGRLAEFIVARALGISTEDVSDSWAAWDLTAAHFLVRIEVKSAACLQSWAQQRYSPITFMTPKTLAWDPETNVTEKTPRRQADVYVFTARLTHKNIETLNPLDVSQWRFFVVPTTTLNSAHAAHTDHTENTQGYGKRTHLWRVARGGFQYQKDHIMTEPPPSLFHS